MSVITITNANVYLDGTLDLIGKLAKVELPTVEPSMEDMSGLGLASELEIPTGLKTMVLKLTWKSFVPDALRHRLRLFSAVPVQIRGNLETYDSSGRADQQPAVVLASVMFSKVALGALERAKPIAGMEDEARVQRLELKVGGEILLKYDLYANIYDPGTGDELATLRANQ